MKDFNVCVPCYMERDRRVYAESTQGCMECGSLLFDLPHNIDLHYNPDVPIFPVITSNIILAEE